MRSAVPAPTAIDTAQALDLLAAEGKLTADALAGRLDGAIPHCPGWTGRDLATHLGGVYRWVSVIVDERLNERPDRERSAAAFTDPDPSDDAGVLTRLREGNERLVAVLRAAPEDLACWTIWGADAARGFWVRRQLHETVVHRVDAQNVGRTPDDADSGAGLDPVVAADGVDELMTGFATRYAKKLVLPAAAVLVVHADDTGHSWWAQLGPDEPVFGRGEPPVAATTTVRGAAGELLLLLWNRRSADGLDVAGDPGMLVTWRERAYL
jgi:uncharacterized protein (TIGR03083 family)